MLTQADFQAFDRAVDTLKRATWGRFGVLPDYQPAPDLVPEQREATELRPFHDDYHQQRIRDAVRQARAYAAQQNALDAPFSQMARERAEGQGRGARQRDASLPLGLVSNATSGMAGINGEQKRPLRDKLLINRDAQRVKRMRTTVGHAARLLHFDAHTERHAQRWNKKFITLTYAKGEDWRPGHFSKFRDALRQWCRRRKVKCRFVWVAELQERGALHYHVVVWLPKGKFLPFADARGWWPHGSTNIKTAQSPIGYITKYASKTTANEAAGYPKGARMHGHGGLDGEGRRHIRYWMAPMWVRDELSGRADIRKVCGGYMDKFTGEFLASPWRVCVGPGGEVWAYRIDQQEMQQ